MDVIVALHNCQDDLRASFVRCEIGIYFPDLFVAMGRAIAQASDVVVAQARGYVDHRATFITL